MARNVGGFTLVEALTALAVAAVLIAVAVPAWSAAVARGHAMDAQTRITTTLVRVVERSSAVGQEVVVCPSPDGARCVASTDWSGGWIGFADLDGDRQRRDGEPIVHVDTRLEGRATLVTSAGRSRLVFQPSGGNAGSNVTFTLCHPAISDKATTLVLANNGRMRGAIATAPQTEACLRVARQRAV